MPSLLTTKDTKDSKAISFDALSARVVDSAFTVHKTMGPGLLESVYHECLCLEMTTRGIPFEKQKSIPVFYNEQKLDSTFRLDIVVDNQIILEIKAIEKLLPIHTAQILNYLKISKLKTGLLINFNTPLFKDGIKRISL
jgi:GxxExxY protein